MPHSQTHAPLHSAYELVVLRNKLQLWFWNEMCGQTIQVRNFQKAQKPIKFYLKPYWRGFFTMLWWLKGETGTADIRIFCIEI